MGVMQACWQMGGGNLSMIIPMMDDDITAFIGEGLQAVSPLSAPCEERSWRGAVSGLKLKFQDWSDTDYHAFIYDFPSSLPSIFRCVPSLRAQMV